MYKRTDRSKEETRKIEIKVGVIPRANGSATFSFGDTKAIAAVYGPRTLHPEHLQNPEKALLRCYYDLLSFSVTERKKPGPNRRSSEISFVTTKALEQALLLEKFPNAAIDVFITILQADASTRCAGINAASLALAQAGIPMIDFVSSVSIGKLGNELFVDITKEEEDYEENGEKATDIPIAVMPRMKKITLLQLDGNISTEQLKNAIELGMKTCQSIYEKQKETLKNSAIK